MVTQKLPLSIAADPAKSENYRFYAAAFGKGASAHVLRRPVSSDGHDDVTPVAGLLTMTIKVSAANSTLLPLLHRSAITGSCPRGTSVKPIASSRQIPIRAQEV